LPLPPSACLRRIRLPPDSNFPILLLTSPPLPSPTNSAANPPPSSRSRKNLVALAWPPRAPPPAHSIRKIPPRGPLSALRRWIAAASGVCLVTAAVRIWPLPRRRRDPEHPRPRQPARRGTLWSPSSAGRCFRRIPRAARRGRA
jgi:hypothetical protein